MKTWHIMLKQVRVPRHRLLAHQGRGYSDAIYDYRDVEISAPTRSEARKLALAGANSEPGASWRVIGQCTEVVNN